MDSAHNPPLRPGDQLPHFDIRTTQGERVRYADLWQRRNIVLVTIAAVSDPDAEAYVSTLQARVDEFAAAETALVITSTPVTGLPEPGALVADRWGEVVYVAHPEPGDIARLPSGDELLNWIHFVRIQCPECPPT